MSLFSKPAPVASSHMVPPTWLQPDDWLDGRTDLTSRLPSSAVSTYPMDPSGLNDWLRCVHPWHSFPTTQPPCQLRRRFFLAALDPLLENASIAPKNRRSFVAWSPHRRFIALSVASDASSFDASRFTPACSFDLVLFRAGRIPLASSLLYASFSLRFTRSFLNARSSSLLASVMLFARDSMFARDSFVTSDSILLCT